jgi:hypothetical protein
MPEEVWLALADAGSKRVLALACGGVLMLVGSVGSAIWLARPRQAGPEGIRPPRYLLIIVSSLLVVSGALAILGIGVILPLGAMRQRVVVADSLGTKLGELNWLRGLSQLSQRHRQQLDKLITTRSESYIRELLSRPRYRDSKRLNRHELRVCSQNGEDGSIAEIFRRIGTGNRFFVEFGASDGVENNTALLLRQGWSGLWIDADTAAVNKAKETFARYIADGKLTVLEEFITAENIEGLFRKGKVPEEFDLLSIDIDRNDYHVWEKISHYRPRVAVIEYNSGIPPTMSWVIPYDPKAFGWNEFGTGNGASLKALEELGARKGYRLVGCELCGVNSFFVRNDLVGDHFAAPYTAENHFEPFRWEQIAFPRCDPWIDDDLEKKQLSQSR